VTAPQQASLLLNLCGLHADGSGSPSSLALAAGSGHLLGLDFAGLGELVEEVGS
jgi:hypothetical protein